MILVIAGLVGLVYTGVATLTSMILFGSAAADRRRGRRTAARRPGPWHQLLLARLVVAALNIAAEWLGDRRPDAAAEALTTFAALLFLTGGVFRVVGSLVVRGAQFGWTLLQGVDLLLGILVLDNWPSSSKYVIGCFFSLALLFDGLGLIATGFGGRRIVHLVSGRDR